MLDFRFLGLLTLVLSATGVYANPILSIRSENGACVLRLYDFEKDEVWLTLPACPASPEDFVFDTNGHSSILFANGKFFAAEWKSSPAVKLLGNEFSTPKDGRIVLSKIWFSKTNGNLRVAQLIEPPIQIEENKEGEWFRREFQLPENTWVSRHDLSEGVPSIAIVRELKEGQWHLLAKEPTTSQAEGALGLRVVSKFMDEKPGMMSLRDLLSRATCRHLGCDKKRVELSAAKIQVLKKAITESKARPPSRFGYIPLAKSSGVLFGIDKGDSTHAMLPLFYCKREGSDICRSFQQIKRQPSAGGSYQIGLSRAGDYLLISDEYEGTNAEIFGPKEDAPVRRFPADAVVVSLPFAVK